MFFNTLKNQSEYIKQLKKNIDLTKNNCKDIQKQLLDEFIMTINEVQDIQALNLSEKEKDEMRNAIINQARTKYVTKLIELSNETKIVRQLKSNNINI